MYEGSGEIRITKTKSTLKPKLQVTHGGATLVSPESVIIDECALLGLISGPHLGRSLTMLRTSLVL